MKQKFLVLIGMLVLIIALGACTFHPPVEASADPQDNTPVTSSIISASTAGEIAIEAVGGGDIQGIETVQSGESVHFFVRVDYAGSVFNVVLDAQTGNFISLNLNEQSQEREATTQAGNETVDSGAMAQTSAPQTAANPSQNRQRGVRPTNPAISLERAIEIGYAEIARRGHDATFREHSGMDWERGQWVWELEFRVVGGRLPIVEMYVNVDTGEIVKFEWDD